MQLASIREKMLPSVNDGTGAGEGIRLCSAKMLGGKAQTKKSPKGTFLTSWARCKMQDSVIPNQ